MTFDLLLNVEDFLDREHKILLSGDLAGLTRLSAERDRITDAMAQANGTDLIAMQKIKSKAQRNANLLASARKGLASVRARLDQVRGGDQLRTYDRAGRYQTIGPTTLGNSHRV